MAAVMSPEDATREQNQVIPLDSLSAILAPTTKE
jgi:hypothetical protein